METKKLEESAQKFNQDSNELIENTYKNIERYKKDLEQILQQNPDPSDAKAIELRELVLSQYMSITQAAGNFASLLEVQMKKATQLLESKFNIFQKFNFETLKKLKNQNSESWIDLFSIRPFFSSKVSWI